MVLKYKIKCANMALKLSSQDKKDLDKFTRFFTIKATQIIVQSRLGEKVSTTCKSQIDSSDWFNLAITDHPDVLAETKKALNGEMISPQLPLCVETSLHTVDGDKLVLETWCLSMLPEHCDSTLRSTPHAVYNGMGMMLKSLLSVTRVLPAYKYSRTQGPDSHVILYRIYMEQPQYHSLGEGYKQVRIGQLCTPIGTLQMSVCYRMKMAITPTKSGKSSSIMVKSDHFNTHLSPKNLRYKQGDDKSNSLGGRMKVAAFANTNKKVEEPDLIPNLTFSRLLMDKLTPVVKEPEEEDDDEVEEEKEDQTHLEDQNGNSPQMEMQKSNLTMKSTNDDFIMVELKPPFASTNVNSELGMFYKEWQSAPPLQTFVDVPTLAEQVQDLTQQLESFESDMREYDTLLQSLCQSPNNN